VPKRKLGRKRKDELSAAESYRTTPEKALKMADDLLMITDAEPGELEKHPQFPGVSVKSGNRINMITIMRIHGYWDKEIADTIHIRPDEIARLERSYPEAFVKAEATALTTAVHKMDVNCLRVRAAAAKRAPEMLDVLYNLAKGDEIPPHIRLKASRDWLNLMGMNMPIGRGGTQDKLNKGTMVAINQVFNDDKTTYTDVVDGEVIDD